MEENDLNRYKDIAEQILCALDCPRALSIVIMLRHDMWDEIASQTIDPMEYNDSISFFRAYQAVKLLSKAKWLPTTIDKKAVAKRKFVEAEELCSSTNITFSRYRRMELKFQPDIEQVFFSARRKIGKVLGESLYKWTEFCDFGPGADGSTENGLTSAYNKLNDPGCVTSGAYPYMNVFSALTRLGHVFVGNIGTGRLDITYRRGNTVTFVPKNAKTDRPIAVEPRWNMWLQKGFGRFLRRRLKYFGVNLDYQGLNQAFAVYGSYTGKYATIDLASASDTISMEMVRAMLPDPWLTILDSLRSPFYRLDGEWKEYKKWSSMGNGYTFELESMIFWALCSSVTDDVAVYGDDLIVPTQSYEQVVQVLEVCGFRVNPEKSFHFGPFRESCGTDAFNGDRVTPIYWKEFLDDQGTLTLVNQITVLSRLLGGGDFRCRRFRKVWKDLVYQLPKRFQQRGPTTISTVVHDSSTSWNAVRKNGWDGSFINVWVPVPRKHRYQNYNAAVLSQEFQPSSDGYTIRDRVVWIKRTVFVPCGYEDIGPWA
jgi:hypothetical protein